MANLVTLSRLLLLIVVVALSYVPPTPWQLASFFLIILIFVTDGLDGYIARRRHETSLFGALLMAGGFLAIGSCMSALTRNQVVAFILGVVACFVFLLAGFPLVLDAFRAWAPTGLVDAIASLSFLAHFEALSKGVIDLRDVLYFGMTIAFFLLATSVVLDARRSE